jgi:hypothetical protein
LEKPPKPKRELFSGENIPGEETWNDTDDYLDHLAYVAEVAKEEGTVGQLPVQPDDINDEEAMRLALLVSQQLETPRLQPSYASAVMSAPSAPPPAVTPAASAPPPAPVITMEAPAPNWPRCPIRRPGPTTERQRVEG